MIVLVPSRVLMLILPYLLSISTTPVYGWSLQQPRPAQSDDHLIHPDPVVEPPSSSTQRMGRRQWLLTTSTITGAASLLLMPAHSASGTPSRETAAGELPMALRSFTKLAPLKSSSSSSDKLNNNNNKSLNLPVTELVERLQRNLSEGATGKGSYIVTGDLAVDLFRDDCRFIDPTNRVDSLQQYQRALTILFDPATSRLDLLEPLRVVHVDGDNDVTTIQGRYRCRGTLKLPWRPQVAAFESDIVYTVDPATGLVAQQEQRWTKSAATALQETFTPSLFQPPPRSSLPPSSDEPATVTRLFETVNGRRNSEYSAEERQEIEALIGEIIASEATSTSSTYRQQQQSIFQPEQVYGTWRLVYLRPGPDGTGIDRRVPFPELPFNDNYQVFGRGVVSNGGVPTTNNKHDNENGEPPTTPPTNAAKIIGHISNRGELWGPNLFVRVSGDLIDPDCQTTKAPKRLRADIRDGALCASSAFCVPLPISGVGLFDSVYLGDRLRIGQNINGGGALVVQVRMDNNSARDE